MKTLRTSDELQTALARLDALDAGDWSVTSATTLATLGIVSAARRAVGVALAEFDADPRLSGDERAAKRLAAGDEWALLVHLLADILARRLAADAAAERAARRTLAKRRRR